MLAIPSSVGTWTGSSRRTLTTQTRIWVDWYLRRYERALDPPQGTIQADDIARFARQVVETEIPEQLRYHHANFRQLGLLDRRLAAAARFSLGAAIAVAALYGISVYVLADINRDTWKPVAIVVFTCCRRWRRLSTG